MPPMVPHSKLPSNAGDNTNTRVAGQVFLCLTVLLAVILLLCLGKSGKQGSGHLQEQLCCTDTCALQGWNQKPGTEQHDVSISEHH